MPVGELSVELRSGRGKGAARRLRTSGKIPAICYGAGRDPLSISLAPKALVEALDPQKRRNTLIHMKIEGGETLTVMLKDYQVDPVKNVAEHADFITVDLDREIHVTVPVVLVGKSIGVKEGGIMHQVHRMLAIAAKPNAIPAKIECDVTELAVGDAFHVRDLKLTAGVRALLDGGDTITVVVAPKEEKVEAAAEVVATEAAPAAGAKPDAKAAAGAKPDAKAAAAKPAAKK